MRDRILRITLVAVISALILSVPLATASANPDQEGVKEGYRKLLNKTDRAIRVLRLKDENAAREAIADIKLELENDKYPSVFSKNSEIRNYVDTLIGEKELNVGKIKALRNEVKETASKEGIDLPFIYENAVLVILGVSIGLSIIVNLISRKVVDWKELNKVRNKQSELKDKLDKARKESNTKKAHKLQQEQQEFMQKHAGTMFSPMKTMIIIIIPFFIMFTLLRNTYGGWVVAWVPFNFPWPNINIPLLSNFFRGTFASLGFFGWYLICYFGLSQIFRKMLIPSD